MRNRLASEIREANKLYTVQVNGQVTQSQVTEDQVYEILDDLEIDDDWIVWNYGSETLAPLFN